MGGVNWEGAGGGGEERRGNGKGREGKGEWVVEGEGRVAGVVQVPRLMKWFIFRPILNVPPRSHFQVCNRFSPWS